tara:strand:+ start:413 stop:643 length:231 start_codon:yes stop_codon:yes gene_type:complete
MKLMVEQADYRNEKIVMKTSESCGRYSIKFHKKDWAGFQLSSWGHLNLRQTKRLLKDLKRWIKMHDKVNFKRRKND